MTTNCPVVISFDFQHEYDRGNNMYFHLNLLYFRKRITFHHNNSALSLESISKWQMWRRYFSIKVAWISRLHVIRGIGMKEWEMKTEGFKQTLTNLLFVHNASCNTHLLSFLLLDAYLNLGVILQGAARLWKKRSKVERCHLSTFYRIRIIVGTLKTYVGQSSNNHLG